jgi:cobalt-zinc-cadmium efflux system protein
LIKQSLRILLNYAPSEVDPSTVIAAIHAFPAVQAVENLRLFSVTSAQVMLTAQVKVTPTLDAVARDRLLHQIQTDLQAKFAITQIVLQLQGSDRALHPLFSQNLTAHVLGITRRTED